MRTVLRLLPNHVPSAINDTELARFPDNALLFEINEEYSAINSGTLFDISPKNILFPCI